MIVQSIQRKLMTVVMTVTVLALLLASILYGINDIASYRASMRRDLITLAEIIGANARSALEFDDEKFAAQTLSTLSAKPNITIAALYKSGTVLAEYHRADAAAEKAPALPGGGPPASWEGGRLRIFHPITRGTENLGAIYLESDLAMFYERLRRDFLSAGLTLLAVVLVSFFLTSKLQKVISGPVVELANTARAVAAEQNYSIRARKTSEDEIGFLIDRFNEMMDQAERHQKELRSINDRLLESEKKAQHATHAKSAFLANMSHELRTPMNAIIGYTEMLREEAEDRENNALLADLNKIHAAAKHLLALINDILDLSKVEAGKMSVYAETFDVEQMLAEVCATVQPLLAKNKNRFELRRDGELGRMRSDVTKVRQILLNLLSNACKFTENGAVGLIASRAAEDKLIRFQITDSGIGMTPEQLGRLFESFSQADTSISRKYGGTGLGLAVSKKFAQMLGGDITVESAPGQGSTFTVTLARELATPAEAVAAPAIQRNGSARRVLVIDDEASSRDLMQRHLGKAGYQVTTSSGGEEGLRLARGIRPDVITLDVMMPGMDGWAVLSRLKADKELAEIPVIMVTILDEKNLGLALGASDYLTKPIDWQRLVEVIRRNSEAGAIDILVVEDDPETREVLHRVLSKAGWNITEAANGREALQALNVRRPSLILLDLMMPEMDGFQFVQELRRASAWKDIPVIVITSKDLSDGERAKLAGSVSKILSKSGYSTEDLFAELDRALARSRIASADIAI